MLGGGGGGPNNGLASLQGVEMGFMLHKPKICANLMGHLAHMQTWLVQHFSITMQRIG